VGRSQRMGRGGRARTTSRRRARRARTTGTRTKREPRRINKAARAVAAHHHTDAGPDQIVCLLCGETYRSITYSHLRLIHGFEGEHPVRDYKEMFGLEVAVCEEVRRRAREVQVERHKKAGRHWTKPKILREIRKRRRSDHGLAYSRAPVALTQAARRAFGGWDAALRAAGVDPREHRYTNVWDEERMAKAIRRHACGGRRVSASWVEEADPELHHAAYRLVGNWAAAIRTAGLDVRDHREPKRWSLDRVEAWVRETHAAGGDIRSVAAPAGARGRVAKETDLTWSEFVESLEIPYPGQKKRLDWTDNVVLTEIRKRRRRGLALHAEGVVQDVGQALLKQARQRFGSWDDALREAGLDPVRIRRSGVWTRERVISAIRARAEAGKSLLRKDVVAEDPRLVKAAAREFPYSWGRAVEAAGVGRGRPGRGQRRDLRRHK